MHLLHRIVALSGVTHLVIDLKKKFSLLSRNFNTVNAY